MKRAIIAISQSGVALAKKIREKSDGQLFVLEKYAEKDVIPIDGSLKKFMGEIFKTYGEIVMIMSCGIAMRCISPWLASKFKDPAVVVCDDTGKYAISLLSGHMGGANDLAKKMAGIIGGDAIITTASDNRGMEGVDMVAKRYHLEVDDYDSAKLVTSAMINGKKVALIDEYGLYSSDGNLVKANLGEINGKAVDAILYMGNKDNLGISDIPHVKLSRKCLVIGIGCRKAMDVKNLISKVDGLLKEYNISSKAVKKVATVDIKKDEPGIIGLAKYLHVPLEVIDRSELLKVEDKFQASKFVKEIIGVGSVCEPAGFIASQYGDCIVPKKKLGGITVSIFQLSPEVDHEE